VIVVMSFMFMESAKWVTYCFKSVIGVETCTLFSHSYSAHFFLNSNSVHSAGYNALMKSIWISLMLMTNGTFPDGESNVRYP